MKIKDWIIIGLFVSLCFVLGIGIGRGKTERAVDASSTIQNINSDELVRGPEDATFTIQDIEELMRKRMIEHLKQTIFRGGFALGDITILDVAEELTIWSKGRYGREWGVEIRVGGRERLDERLPTSMTVSEDMSLYDLLYQIADATDIEVIIEPEGVILCREWDK
ncbi:MAG: hypothetical protein GX625_10870 [Clostridiaceae bacterium]|nr:hypothetical protein [Clostridiaceae bacterium]